MLIEMSTCNDIELSQCLDTTIAGKESVVVIICFVHPIIALLN